VAAQTVLVKVGQHRFVFSSNGDKRNFDHIPAQSVGNGTGAG
jgi:hypothetical protein